VSAVPAAREPSARYPGTVQPMLVRQFELVATAPGGVARLRELILALAVQGKVVQQDSDDEPASELLRRIRSERASLVAAGSIKQGKPSAPISPEEAPCSLPRGWAWVRFGDLIHELCTGPFGSLIHKEDYVNGGVPLINPSHMIDGRIEHDPAVSVSASMASQLSAYRLDTGDVLLARRGEMGRYALVTEREAGWLCGTGSFFLKLSKAYDRRFFGLTLEDPRLRRHLLGESVGATMTNLNQRILLDVVVAVAPLTEQARIVARVDELMQLCDALEAKGRLEAQQHARLLETLLGTLTDSTTPEELAANWQRVAEHFDLLMDRPEAVDALEQTILQLAVRGTLVRQDAKDEPASFLLRRIRSDKDRLVAEGKIKSDKPLATLDSAEVPFEIPVGWDWVRLGSIAGIERGGSPRPIEAFLTDSLDGLNWIKIGDTEKGGKYITSARERIRPEGLSKTRKVYPGDFLLTNSMSFGRPYITQIEGCIHDGWLRISPPSSLNKDYLYLLLSSSFMRELFAAAAAGGVVQNLNADKVRGVPIPLPPLAEQTRIVTRVTELLRLCADLRQRLAAGQATQSRLAEALVESALS